MKKFQIRIYKDYTTAEKNLKGVTFLLYKQATSGVFLLVRGLFATINSGFKDKITNDEVILSIENKNEKVLKSEYDKVRAFLMSDVKAIKENEKFKKIDKKLNSNRWFSKFYNWSKNKAENILLKNSTEIYLNSCSIYIDTELINITAPKKRTNTPKAIKQ